MCLAYDDAGTEARRRNRKSNTSSHGTFPTSDAAHAECEFELDGNAAAGLGGKKIVRLRSVSGPEDVSTRPTTDW
jgi:hypothetical protein